MPNRPITKKETQAWNFSNLMHKGQVRKFLGTPYFDAHVQKVNGIVKQYSKNEDLLCSSLLHDVIEDCYENKWEGYSHIKNEFGEVIANIVLELTSDSDEIKYKWDGSKKNYLMWKMVNMSDGALIIKLSDRLQNISDAFTASVSFRKNYYNEALPIIVHIESNRKLNDVHKRIIADIRSKLDNIKSIFKL